MVAWAVGRLSAMAVQRWRGIASFVAAFAGTVPRGTRLTLEKRDPPDFGYGVWAGDRLLGIVALVPEEDNTTRGLTVRLAELYVPEPPAEQAGKETAGS
jgi:hypothetical protein